MPAPHHKIFTDWILSLTLLDISLHYCANEAFVTNLHKWGLAFATVSKHWRQCNVDKKKSNTTSTTEW